MEQHFIFLFRKQERISIQLTFDVLYSECQSNKGKEQTMYIIQNALKNLARNKGRNLLVGIITFFLILSTTVALTINSTTNEIIQDYKTRFGSKISFQVDFDKLMAENSNNQNGNMSFPTAPNITSEQYIQFADSEYLKTYQMDILARIGIPKLEPIGGRKGGATFYGEDGEEQADLSYDAKLLAYSDTNSLPDFADGLRKIIEGKMFAKANECLISADFANLNSLTVGDSFSVTEVMGRQEVTLTVSGIYADATQATPEAVEGVISLDGASANRRNEILVNMDTMEQCFDVKNLAVNAEYELKSPEYLKAFTKEVREKGLPDVYTVVTDEESYNKIVTPVEGLAKITMTFMIVVLLIGGAILLLVTAMAIRERKYEIGVLRAMGMKKAKAALMLVIEMVTITAIYLVVGLGIGSVLAQPVVDVLIAGQAETAQNLQAIQVHLMPATSLQIALIALLLALLSSIAGVIFITKYEPMKILSERN